MSLYIRYPEKVSERTGAKIQHAIDQLGYVHNKIASQFTGGRSSSMAVVLPSLANIIFSRVIQQIERTVSEQGYQLSIASHDHNLEKEEAQVRAILQWSPAVIAIAGADHKPETLKMLENSGVPVVQMWQVDGSNFSAQVGNDHIHIGYEAARFLVESGCKNWVTSPRVLRRIYARVNVMKGFAMRSPNWALASLWWIFHAPRIFIRRAEKLSRKR